LIYYEFYNVIPIYAPYMMILAQFKGTERTDSMILNYKILEFDGICHIIHLDFDLKSFGYIFVEFERFKCYMTTRYLCICVLHGDFVDLILVEYVRNIKISVSLVGISKN